MYYIKLKSRDMKKKVLVITATLIFFTSFFANNAIAATDPISEIQGNAPQNLLKYSVGASKNDDGSGDESYGAFAATTIAPISLGLTGYSKNGVVLKSGLIPQQGQFVARLFEQNISSKEYFADVLNNIGVPQVAPSVYAQGTGYSAMSSFLPFWKIFRNIAYSLYIIMFVVVGIMIMLRTKVNAQTIITIQSALPNLLITLLLITFSYAIVGLMIDIMYFIIYFVVYVLSSPGIEIIQTPTKAIARLLSNSAFNVIFAGRDSIISAVSVAITSVLHGIGESTTLNGGDPSVGILASVVGMASWLGFGYLLAAIWLAFSMLKLMWELLKCYVMLIVQVVTAPLQILMNALPGSKAFSSWLKRTASYLLPFPVVASMFLMAAVLIGDPSRAVIVKDGTTFYGNADSNPFGINNDNEFYANYGEGRNFTSSGATGASIWLPPFTLTEYSAYPADLMVIIGFFIVGISAQAAKMAQEWLQVKESPYVSQALTGFGGLAAWPVQGAYAGYQRRQSEKKQKTMYGEIGNAIGDKITQKP